MAGTTGRARAPNLNRRAAGWEGQGPAEKLRNRLWDTIGAAAKAMPDEKTSIATGATRTGDGNEWPVASVLLR